VRLIAYCSDQNTGFDRDVLATETRQERLLSLSSGEACWLYQFPCEVLSYWLEV